MEKNVNQFWGHLYGQNLGGFSKKLGQNQQNPKNSGRIPIYYMKLQPAPRPDKHLRKYLEANIKYIRKSGQKPCNLKHIQRCSTIKIYMSETKHALLWSCVFCQEEFPKFSLPYMCKVDFGWPHFQITLHQIIQTCGLKRLNIWQNTSTLSLFSVSERHD